MSMMHYFNCFLTPNILEVDYVQSIAITIVPAFPDFRISNCLRKLYSLKTGPVLFHPYHCYSIFLNILVKPCQVKTFVK